LLEAGSIVNRQEELKLTKSARQKNRKARE